MCGRFSLFRPATDIEATFDITLDFDLSPRYNIAPGDDLLVVRHDEPAAGDRLQWGLVPHWVDDPSEYSQPINARSETVDEKPFFRSAFRERRCLIIADGVYEWAGERGSKQPYRIERLDQELFAMAGLWESWRANGETLRSCTILTTDPNDTVAPIHNRMPVILEDDETDAWLEAEDTDQLKDLLDPYPDASLTAYRISTAVNDPDTDSPDLIEPIDDPQSGLGDFA